VHINCVLSDPEKFTANLDMYRNFFPSAAATVFHPSHF
jgi:hypothetical protein